MSTCPSKDLHSVYLDNELPEIYKVEYEAHIKDCTACQKELQKLKGLQNILRADSQQITPDSHYLDQSFERLQIKLKYNKNTNKTFKEKKAPLKVNQFVYFGVAAAAAAVFALVIPVRISNAKTADVTNGVSVASVTAPVATSVANNLGGAGGFGSMQNVSSMNAIQASNVAFGGKSTGNVSLDGGKTVIISGNIDESALASDRYGYPVKRDFSNNSNVEVFRPNFEEGAVYIKITLPEMDGVHPRFPK